MGSVYEEDSTKNIRVEEFPSINPVVGGINKEQLNYSFWTSRLKESDKIIMNLDDINNFNVEIQKKVDKVVNLEKYKDTILKKELVALINDYELPTVTMYDDNGKVLKDDFFKKVYNNTNIQAIEASSKISYGVSLRKTSIRSFPTECGVYDSQVSRNFDRFQETGLEPCEAVLILHISLDKKWYFVQMYNYRGWVKTEDIAVANDKSEVFDYINSSNFITITGNHIRLDNNDSTVNDIFNMGDKLPLATQEKISYKNNNNSYIVKLPIRGENNLLAFKEEEISKSKDAVIGYLPYTRENIIKQAFKLQGDKYDWGNKFQGRDCSSFVAYIFKCFGILLPRNTNEQENSFGKQLKFSSVDNIDKRNKLFDNIEPGAVIFMPGHEMLYLGKLNGEAFIIHDFTSYGKKEVNKYMYTPVFSVNVTPAMITLSSGATYLSKFTSVLQIEK